MVVPDDPGMPLAPAPAPGPSDGSTTTATAGATDERVHLRLPSPTGQDPAGGAPRDPRATDADDRLSGPGTGDPARNDGGPARPSCTVAQLRRFIKSRPWIPLHELRRRFGISGVDDDVTPIRVADHTLFIGLPPAEGRLVEELLAGGDVGYELALDPGAPIVVGVYPMRPVPRG